MLSDGWDADWMGLSLGLIKERGAQIGALAPNGAVGIGMGTPASSLRTPTSSCRTPTSWHRVPINVPVPAAHPSGHVSVKKAKGEREENRRGH